MNHVKCINCNQPFTEKNVFSQAGKRETQISGMCEICFDGIMIDPNDDTDGLVKKYQNYIKEIKNIT